MSDSNICIITARNIYDSPCLEKYEAIIDEPFDIVYWDRHDIVERCTAKKIYKFVLKLNPSASTIAKLTGYYKFRKHVIKVLKSHKYKRLIVFPTHVAWLILGVLKREYKEEYILDIRDYSGENSRFIYSLTKKAIKNAGMVSVTSKAYEVFLPKGYNYVLSHNIQEISKSLVLKYRTRVIDSSFPIVMSFIGTIRFIEQQKKLILTFKNDDRFVLQFIGRGSEQLADFCETNGIQNVVLKGRFNREDLPAYYLESDLAINVYGHNDSFLDYALSNKLYSAALMGMPIICSKGTYMAQIATEYEIGFVFDEDNPNMVNELYKYMRTLDRQVLFANDDRFISSVRKDEEDYQKAVKTFLRTE